MLAALCVQRVCVSAYVRVAETGTSGTNLQRMVDFNIAVSFLVLQ